MRWMRFISSGLEAHYKRFKGKKMNTTLVIQSALRHLNQHRGRALLTMLGIIIGTASIIAILAIGNGAAERVRREILANGQNYMFIHTGNWFQEQGKLLRLKRIQSLTTNDIAILLHYVPSIKYISPIILTRQTITRYTKSLSSEIKGGNYQLNRILNRPLAKGQWFNPTHTRKRCRVIVLGAKAASELFGKSNPIGEAVQINKCNFTVIGVLQHMESQFGMMDPNLDSFIPYTTAKKFFSHINGNKIPALTLSTNTLEDMPAAVNLIKKILRVRRHITPSAPDDFSIMDQASMLRAAQHSSDTLTLFLLIIAIISLIVGGIGVMNIMLVSVKERTKEIGIRMALGATRRMILAQFLTEALVLCSIGGMIGLTAGVATPYFVSIFTGWLVIITPTSLIIACAAMAGVGLAFGYYPARQASELNPVEALIEQ